MSKKRDIVLWDTMYISYYVLIADDFWTLNLFQALMATLLATRMTMIECLIIWPPMKISELVAAKLTVCQSTISFSSNNNLALSFRDRTHMQVCRTESSASVVI